MNKLSSKLNFLKENLFPGMTGDFSAGVYEKGFYLEKYVAERIDFGFLESKSKGHRISFPKEIEGKSKEEALEYLKSDSWLVDEEEFDLDCEY